MKKNTLNNKLRAILTLSLALIVTLSMSVASFAGTLTSKTALTKALKNANLTKSQVKCIEVEYDDGKYEVEFIKRSNRAEYSFEYSKSGKLLEKSVDYNRAKNYGAKKISKTTAINTVVKFGNFKKSTVKNGTCVLVRDDGERIYKIKFKTTSYRFEYEVHANTGKVLEYSKELRR